MHLKLKYSSLTTPEVSHNSVNMLTELIFLNKRLSKDAYPWRGQHRLWWGKTVAALSKIMKRHGITEDQIAFYIYRCHPTEISQTEFGKMAVVAKKLFRKYDLTDLVEMYRNKLEKVQDTGGIEDAGYAKQTRTKSLAAFLEELENE